MIDRFRTTEHPQSHEHDIEVLRDRWDQGRASGRAGPLDIRRIIAEERARFGGGAKQHLQ